ncbi:MAG TPA: 23S rRNA (guanosine(2251)-2'-O)-methyltransferase RlmB [Bacteroidia bacterium]|nr:23S rRNA (guanosine(2251)-2'-O)-methyltransferase RlmB [Bacteroidia bacterium]
MMHDEKQVKDSVIFGIRPVMEAILAGKEPERIFIQRDLQGSLMRELRELLREHNFNYTPVPVEKLNRLTKKNHQGVVCFLSLVSYAKLDQVIPGIYEAGRVPLIILLDRVTDVRNFGAICRTAECMGADAVVVPEKGGAMANADAVKASAGALNRITLCREYNLKESINYLAGSGLKIVGCTEKAAESIDKVDFSQPVCIIMGSEEDGISPEYLKLCNERVKIPMAGTIASLNVSVAAGMLLYEIYRQRNQ